MRFRALCARLGSLLLAGGTVLSATGGPDRAAAQASAPIAVGPEVFVGSEVEEYLRLLQTVGKVPGYP